MDITAFFLPHDPLPPPCHLRYIMPPWWRVEYTAEGRAYWHSLVDRSVTWTEPDAAWFSVEWWLHDWWVDPLGIHLVRGQQGEPREPPVSDRIFTPYETGRLAFCRDRIRIQEELDEYVEAQRVPLERRYLRYRL